MGLLFDTPGLSTSAAPVAASPSGGGGNKRKRGPSDSGAKEAAVEVNLEKLMKTMQNFDKAPAAAGGANSAIPASQPKPKKAKTTGGGGANGGGQGDSTKKQQPASPAPAAGPGWKKDSKPLGSPAFGGGSPAGSSTSVPNRFKPAKKERPPRQQRDNDSHPASSANMTTPSWGRNGGGVAGPLASVPPHMAAPKAPVRHSAPKDDEASDGDDGASASAPQTAMQAALRAKLAGGRFRMLNETLYTSTGAEAWETMKDQGAFDDYHAGFRGQAASWPTQPIALLKEELSAKPAGTFVADFGCGDATLARDLVPKGLNVISFDLVSKDGWVVEAECSSVPLPGGQKGGQVVDIVVCCLSLMGTDWIEMVREARRVLKAGGEFKVAEVTSRFVNVDAFVSLISSVGFEFVRKDESNTHFMMFDFVKIATGEDSRKKGDNTKKAIDLLRACVYKKREGGAPLPVKATKDEKAEDATELKGKSKQEKHGKQFSGYKGKKGKH